MATADTDSERLFLALWPDAGVRERLGELARRCAEESGGRRVPDENLHLTLAFLGSLGGAAARAAREVVHAIVVTPFALRLERIGFWPRTRVVWVGAENVPTALETLMQDVNGALPALGVAPDRRAFAPHVTVVRRARRRPRVTTAPFEWRVQELCLVRSRLDPGGAHYEVVARSPRRDNSTPDMG